MLSGGLPGVEIRVSGKIKIMPRGLVKERLVTLGFSAFGLLPREFFLLKNKFLNLELAWLAGRGELVEAGLTLKRASGLVEFRRKFDSRSYFFRLRENKIECLFHWDKKYPLLLKNIDDPPFILYGKGDLNLLKKSCLAVVGSRRMSSYGKEMTYKLIKGLVDKKVVIVSGLALGVDAAAHLAALRFGGKTIAIMGTGLDKVYPPENLGLAKRIVKEGGLVLSESPLGFPLKKENFPWRNRLVSGISKGVLVIEGRERSGTLITTRLAAYQGREVFALPGQATDSGSFVPHLLIKQGAKLVETAEDILEELT